MQRIAILGSTGSIGENTLKVIAQHPHRFQVIALTAFDNYKRLAQQVMQFKPKYVAIGKKNIGDFKKLGLKAVKIFTTEDCAMLASKSDVDTVVLAMRGAGALGPFLAALRAGKKIAPANKEALVIAGDLIMREAKKYGATIIPVDSEQSAIFQCLEGQKKSLARVHLTASGGVFRNTPAKNFDRIKIKDILRHPRWKMGAKITVDSATLMNKGFEVIEALRLFNLKHDQIKVIIHPEAIMHSMVEFIDGSWLGQLAITDMKIPIQFALSYPQRLPSDLKPLDLVKLGKLTFEAPDLKKFPALDLAYHAARELGTLPAVLNAANEEAVDAFLSKRLKFTQIYKVVEQITMSHKTIKNPSLTQILAADEEARIYTQEKIG